MIDELAEQIVACLYYDDRDLATCERLAEFLVDSTDANGDVSPNCNGLGRAIKTALAKREADNNE